MTAVAVWSAARATFLAVVVLFASWPRRWAPPWSSMVAMVLLIFVTGSRVASLLKPDEAAPTAHDPLRGVELVAGGDVTPVTASTVPWTTVSATTAALVRLASWTTVAPVFPMASPLATACSVISRPSLPDASRVRSARTSEPTWRSYSSPTTGALLATPLAADRLATKAAVPV